MRRGNAGCIRVDSVYVFVGGVYNFEIIDGEVFSLDKKRGSEYNKRNSTDTFRDLPRSIGLRQTEAKQNISAGKRFMRKKRSGEDVTKELRATCGEHNRIMAKGFARGLARAAARTTAVLAEYALFCLLVVFWTYRTNSVPLGSVKRLHFICEAASENLLVSVLSLCRIGMSYAAIAAALGLAARAIALAVSVEHIIYGVQPAVDVRGENKRRPAPSVGAFSYKMHVAFLQ